MDVAKASIKLQKMLHKNGLGISDDARVRMADDLLNWLNLTEPSPDDLARLVELTKKGQFNAWYCPHCASRVYEGTPDDWTWFQGVDQVDYTSYPGNTDNPQNERLCNSCRFSLPDDPHEGSDFVDMY